ncbi:MAG: DUF2225 domain-containing protein [Lachnospiraceae bacterium]|nr:DUF2225 domain-containing protein [Lachnospiraceae bacterium]
MGNLFSGLDSLGLGKLSDMNVYETEEKVEKVKEEQKPVELTESDFLFDKSFTCPVCDKEFKVKTVRTGKVKLIAADSDLRPKYQTVDSLKYDVVACPHCGYAALNRYFNYMTSAQAKLIKTNISANFKGLATEGDIVTYDEAITKHRLALVNAIVKHAKSSEKAYTCLKTAWLLRGKVETLPEDTPNREEVIKQCQTEEREFLENAYNGFMEAFPKELFPMCGMDENTVSYLVADLARRLGKYEDATRWVSRVLVSRNSNERIKAKSRELKELIAADMKKNQ